MKCGKCKCELDESNAMWWTADGSRKRVNPYCKVCHEESVKGLGIGAARINRSSVELQNEPGNQQRKYDGGKQ